jgi:hypothetical protein
MEQPSRQDKLRWWVVTSDENGRKQIEKLISRFRICILSSEMGLSPE